MVYQNKNVITTIHIFKNVYIFRKNRVWTAFCSIDKTKLALLASVLHVFISCRISRRSIYETHSTTTERSQKKSVKLPKVSLSTHLAGLKNCKTCTLKCCNGRFSSGTCFPKKKCYRTWHQIAVSQGQSDVQEFAQFQSKTPLTWSKHYFEDLAVLS